MKSKRILLIISAAVLICAIAAAGYFFLGLRLGQKDQFEITTYEPTCTQQGFTQYKNLKDGSVTIKDETPALGHAFGGWELDETTGISLRSCHVCGEAEQKIMAAPLGIAQLRLTGDLQQTEFRIF